MVRLLRFRFLIPVFLAGLWLAGWPVMSGFPTPKKVSAQPQTDRPRRVEGADTRQAPVPPAATQPVTTVTPTGYSTEALDKEIAGRFAPIFIQSLGDSPRFDYITKFDFDGDWKGTNNWENAANQKYPLTANVYFSLCESQTHYFIHYAAFHPRDYKGGNTKGTLLSELFQEGARLGGKYDPTGLAQEAVLAHENDLEGCLLVIEKSGNDPQKGKLVYFETLAHNKFNQYRPNPDTDGNNALLYVEPKGHGIYSYEDGKRQAKNQSKGEMRYEYRGRAEDPEKNTTGTVGYDLIPMVSTLWVKAQGSPNETYGIENDYQSLQLEVVKPRKIRAQEIKVGLVGNAFRGDVGGKNMARPPWGWFSSAERDRPLGEWFFDPAKVVKRHYNLPDTFSLAYLHHPILGVYRN
ncbi:MAG: hypothetical protein K1Y36_15110 [Blastocatellia bacterium]|nr:hypothetical protein [Blastocatellia bacterium]